jgi:hypothetical protein
MLGLRPHCIGDNYSSLVQRLPSLLNGGESGF